MDWKLVGAFAFGLLIGWYVYYVNRYRKGDVQIGDITTIIGAIGGGAVLALFDKGSEMFGTYGLGLAVGFFLYFVVLLALVRKSANFDSDWFLDGRRKNPADGFGYGQDVKPTVAPMAPQPSGPGFYGPHPAATQQFFIGGQGAAPVLAAPARVPPVPVANAQRIISTCQDVWPIKKDACNYFVIGVADRLGVALTGQADDIVDQIRGVDWSRLADGPAARDAANQGKFVVAGIKKAEFTSPHDEGHVAIVVAGEMNAAGWAPAGYWGSTDPGVAAKGDAGNPISLCFRQEDKGKITYACRDI